MPAEYTLDSWVAYVNAKFKPSQTISGAFYTAYKNYVIAHGSIRFVKSGGQAEHIRRRDAAAKRMHELQPKFDLQRATNKAIVLYDKWHKSASSQARRGQEKAGKKKPDGDMGGKGGTNAVDFELGGRSFRRGRGRQHE